jgi:hypothetical protein
VQHGFESYGLSALNADRIFKRFQKAEFRKAALACHRTHGLLWATGRGSISNLTKRTFRKIEPPPRRKKMGLTISAYAPPPPILLAARGGQGNLSTKFMGGLP